MTDETSSVRLWPFAAASAGACALAIVVALLLPAAPRGPAVYGVLAASVGALCGLSALAASTGRGLNALLGGFSIGFLARALFVAVGLIASGARGNLALVYVGAFFSVYAATQAVEVLFVHKSSRRLSGATP